MGSLGDHLRAAFRCLPGQVAAYEVGFWNNKIICPVLKMNFSNKLEVQQFIESLCNNKMIEDFGIIK